MAARTWQWITEIPWITREKLSLKQKFTLIVLMHSAGIKVSRYTEAHSSESIWKHMLYNKRLGQLDMSMGPPWLTEGIFTEVAYEDVVQALVELIKYNKYARLEMGT